MKRIGWKELFYVLVISLGTSPVAAQFAPAAGVQGTTAIQKDDAGFKEWATGCTVQRGFMNIADTMLGRASAGVDTNAIGAAGRGSIVSLGDGGNAVVTFDRPVANGPGFDFAVFENGFYTGGDSIAFLELAFVEVSSDGINFTRFPATSDIPTNTQLAMEGVNCRLINNLAGKYVVDYGTPFDLDDLIGTPNLNLNHITHIRIVDVVGSVNPLYATHDKNNNIINDPWPTPFASGGFDLDAVGVLNTDESVGIENITLNNLQVYPNPVRRGDVAYLKMEEVNAIIHVSDLNGRVLYGSPANNKQVAIPTGDFCSGLYLVTIETLCNRYTSKLLVE